MANQPLDPDASEGVIDAQYLVVASVGFAIVGTGVGVRVGLIGGDADGVGVGFCAGLMSANPAAHGARSKLENVAQTSRVGVGLLLQ